MTSATLCSAESPTGKHQKHKGKAPRAHQCTLTFRPGGPGEPGFPWGPGGP